MIHHYPLTTTRTQQAENQIENKGHRHQPLPLSSSTKTITAKSNVNFNHQPSSKKVQLKSLINQKLNQIKSIESLQSSSSSAATGSSSDSSSPIFEREPCPSSPSISPGSSSSSSYPHPHPHHHHHHHHHHQPIATITDHQIISSLNRTTDQSIRPPSIDRHEALAVDHPILKTRSSAELYASLVPNHRSASSSGAGHHQRPRKLPPSCSSDGHSSHRSSTLSTTSSSTATTTQSVNLIQHVRSTTSKLIRSLTPNSVTPPPTTPVDLPQPILPSQRPIIPSRLPFSSSSSSSSSTHSNLRPTTDKSWILGRQSPTTTSLVSNGRTNSSRSCSSVTSSSNNSFSSTGHNNSNSNSNSSSSSRSSSRSSSSCSNSTRLPWNSQLADPTLINLYEEDEDQAENLILSPIDPSLRSSPHVNRHPPVSLPSNNRWKSTPSQLFNRLRKKSSLSSFYLHTPPPQASSLLPLRSQSVSYSHSDPILPTSSSSSSAAVPVPPPLTQSPERISTQSNRKHSQSSARRHQSSTDGTIVFSSNTSPNPIDSQSLTTTLSSSSAGSKNENNNTPITHTSRAPFGLSRSSTLNSRISRSVSGWADRRNKKNLVHSDSQRTTSPEELERRQVDDDVSAIDLPARVDSSLSFRQTSYVSIDSNPPTSSFTRHHHQFNNHKPLMSNNPKRQSPTEIALSRLDEILRGNPDPVKRDDWRQNDLTMPLFRSDDQTNMSLGGRTIQEPQALQSILINENLGRSRFQGMDPSITYSLSPPQRPRKKNGGIGHGRSNSHDLAYSKSKEVGSSNPLRRLETDDPATIVRGNHQAPGAVDDCQAVRNKVVIDPKIWQSISISAGQYHQQHRKTIAVDDCRPPATHPHDDDDDDKTVECPLAVSQPSTLPPF